MMLEIIYCMFLPKRKNINQAKLPTSLIEAYKNLVNEELLAKSRIVISSVALLYLLFNVLDHYVYPELQMTFLKIRIVVAIILFTLVSFTYIKPVQKHVAYISDVSMVLAGAGISLMIYMSDGTQSGYYQGLNLVTLALVTMNSSLVIHNTCAGLGIISTYLIAVFFYGINNDYVEVTSAIFFMGTTLFFVSLMTKLYAIQHFKQFAGAEDLKDANNKLIEAEKIKSDFFANVSHELRTPLTLILTPIESILADSKHSTNTESDKLLRTVHNNTIRLLQMVNGLLDFSKLESGKLEVKREPTNIVELTKMICDDFAPSFKNKEILFSMDIDLDQNTILVDRYLYERILFNLLSNAIKFTSDNGKICLKLKYSEGTLKVFISDTGIGISEEDRKNLFQKFRQLEGSATRRFEGTGLGLAMVKEFSELLGGGVIVDSELGKGSTFTVSINAPLAKSSTVSDISRSTNSHVQKYQITNEKESYEKKGNLDTSPNVLVVEDNVELASYIASLLSDFCNVRIAENGEEALVKISEKKPDLILSDVMMPLMDGKSLCKEVKKNSETISIPVVLLTALTHRDALLEGWASGADDYLFKPFHPQELITRVNSLLQISKEREESKQIIKQKAEELNVLNEELNKSNKQLELFASVASHDLQAPLRRIVSFSNLTLEKYGDVLDEKGKKYIQFMSESSDEMTKLINSILQLSKITSAEPNFEEVNLNDTVSDVLETFADTIEKENTAVTVDKLPTISGDKKQIYILFQNLLSNAIKFSSRSKSPSDKIKPTISISTKLSSENIVEVSVKDNGIGFDETKKEKIFQEFYRLHGEGEYEGTGLGLATCRKIVERHNGKIVAESKVDKGTTFIVKMPVNCLNIENQN